MRARRRQIEPSRRPALKHGYARRYTKRANIYRRWQHMIQRCHNPKDNDYPRYGRFGVRVCNRWRFGEGELTGFECFLADMGLPPAVNMSLDRIDNEQEYAPNNVRWATPKEQANNRHNTRILTIRGITSPLSEWCEQYGIGPKTVLHRLKTGLTDEEAVTNPVAPRTRRSN